MNKKTKPEREPPYMLKNLDRIAETAFFYGFRPVKTPRIEKVDLEQAAAIGGGRADGSTRSFFPPLEEKISLLRTFLDWNLHCEPEPVLLYYKRPMAVRQAPDERHYCLDIVGSFGSVAEAIAVRAAVAILADHGYGKIIVDINSIGDKCSIGQFEKELLNFSRKYGAGLQPEIRQRFRRDPFDVWRCDHEKWLETRKRAPQSLNFLSEASVEHFRQVLEYLETLEIPYRINPGLLGQRHYCSHTIFEIKSAPADKKNPEDEKGAENEAEETYAVGTRHNYLARRVGFKHDTPLVSVNICFKKPTANPKPFFKNKPQPKFFFIQFGSIAKLKSLAVIESLRQARIPVYHLLTSDKFIGQLGMAESRKTPFVIIMGQKEALEDTVVVRRMSSRSQEIVPIPNLPAYLSKLT